jgi:glycosyltransferase involved in cell wall biosynthesis
VRSGVEGFLFDTADELVERTRELLSDPDLRSAMSDAGVDRASKFGLQAFGDRLRSIIGTVEPPADN